MAFDENLADRVRNLLGGRAGVTEKRMFGGVAFLLNGNMCCGVNGEALIVRLPADDAEELLARPHTRRFDMTGRPMKGWILVDPGGVSTAHDLSDWVQRAFRFAGSLPPK
jgi:hypothetical protein